jgi:hypothetical protein
MPGDTPLLDNFLTFLRLNDSGVESVGVKPNSLCFDNTLLTNPNRLLWWAKQAVLRTCLTPVDMKIVTRLRNPYLDADTIPDRVDAWDEDLRLLTNGHFNR